MQLLQRGLSFMATTSQAQLKASDQASERRGRVFKLALPAVGEQVLNTLVGMADVFLVGHLSLTASQQLGYTSASALAGSGLANQLVWLAVVFFMAVGIGCTALVARACGADDMELAGRALHQSLLIGLVLGLIATLLAVLLAEPGLRMLGAAPDVLPLGVDFLNISAIAFVPIALTTIGTAALRGVGDTRSPLLVMLGVNLINIGCSWLLINGNLGMPVLGVAGAAIGATIARTLGSLALIALLVRGCSGLKFRLIPRFDPDILKRILRIGAPSGGEQLVFQGALLLFVVFLTSLGTAAYAAHNVVITIESFSFLPGMGYAAAASALVGQSLGARNPQEAEAVAYETLFQSGLMMSLLGVLMVLFPRQLVGLFITDPAVLAAAEAPMRIAGLLQPFMAINFVMSGGLRGAGDTRWPLYTKLISTWGVRLPLVLLLMRFGYGLAGFWIAMMSDFAVQAALAFWRFRGGKWKSIRV